jgi:hypothetical protein
MADNDLGAEVVRHPSSSEAISDREHAIRGAHGKAVRTGGRSAGVPEAGSAWGVGPLNLIHKQYAPLGYKLPWELLDYVELLAQFNPDYSQAVDNIRTLANSGHELFVEGRKRKAREIKDRLEEKARSIQRQHGGIDGLIDKLLKQAATYGAMCGEWVPNENLNDIVDFIDVNPKSIRFVWEDEHWAPYQKVSHAEAEKAKARGQKVINSDLIKLNELTFHYFAFDAAPGSPYGTPPFIAALAPIGIQADMNNNMAQIVKKVGLLGIIDLVIKQLPRAPGESVEAYESRAGAYLDEYATLAEEMVRDGGLVHFDDVEASTYNISGNAAGATAIFKQNEEQVFSGLKSMPSVQGRSYSTTETYAGVAYDIIIRNTEKYQRACKRMIETGYWLMVTLWSETPDSIRIQFHQNKTLHRLQEAQAEALEIRNASLKWLAGLIDQLGFAQELGYNSPKKPMDEPPPELVGGKSQVPSAQEGAQPGDGTNSNSKSAMDMDLFVDALSQVLADHVVIPRR